MTIHRSETNRLPTPVHIDKPVLVSLLAVMVCLNVAVLWNNRVDIAAGRNDFPIFYSNAQMVHEGMASGLYDFNVENSFNRRVANGLRPPAPPFNHLPYELLLFIPFISFRFLTAYTIWTILNLAMLAGVAVVVQKLYTRCSFSLTWPTILAFFPEWYCLIGGQDSILLLLLFTVSFWLWKQEKDDVAGFILALGLFRPQLVLPFVLVALLAGKWKFVRGFIPGAILAVALSTWVVGFHGMANYFGIPLSQGTEQSASVLNQHWGVELRLMPTWRGFLWLCLPRRFPQGVQTVLLLSGTILGLGWAAKKMRAAKGSAGFDMAFAIILATVLLLSFHSYLCDASIMILPLLIFWPAFSESKTVSRNNAFLAVSLCFLLFLTPIYLVLFATRSMGWLFLIQSVALWVASRSKMAAEKTLVRGQLPRAMSIETMRS